MSYFLPPNALPFNRRNLFFVLVLTVVVVAIAFTTRPPLPTPESFPPPFTAPTLPLAFTPYAGPAGADVLFQAHGLGSSVQFLPGRVRWSSPGPPAGSTGLTLQFLGAAATPAITGDQQLPGVVNYLLGDDPGRWHTHIPTYAQLSYAQLYPGIDLQFSGDQTIRGDWSLKSTYLVSPGADPRQIQWQYAGAADVHIEENTGDLLVYRPGDDQPVLTEAAPVSWQEIGDRRVPVDSRFVLAADNTIGFALGAYDPAYPLLIDPTLLFSSYLGTSTEDTANGIALDSQGNIVVAGSTDAVTFPTTPDALQPTSTGGTCLSPPPFNIPFPCNDGFISKFSPDGSTLIYSTYFGGTQDDGIRSVALDGSGRIVVTGWTTSLDFPLMNPIQPTHGSGSNRTPDSFVARLTADGSALDYSTYLGGNGRDYGDNLALDDQGNAYVTGWTESTDFPTANAVQPTYGGGFFDGTVTKVNAAGTAFAYSSYVGGGDLDYTFGVDVDSAGSVYLTGFTLSNDFPTFNAMQATFGGGIEAYVTKLTPGGDAYVYSTYFGNDDTRGFDIRVNDNGQATLVGVTNSPTFPTVNPLQANYSGAPYDAIVSRFLPDGSALDFSTYLGGNGHDTIHTLALDQDQNLHFTGWSSSTDFPLVDPIQTTPAGGADVIAGRITADLTTLAFSTFLGGSSFDYGFAIAVDDQGQAHVAGYTGSTDFPTTSGAYDPSFNGGDTDAFFAKIGSTAPPPTSTPPPTATSTSTPTATNTPSPPPTSTPPPAGNHLLFVPLVYQDAPAGEFP